MILVGVIVLILIQMLSVIYYFTAIEPTMTPVLQEPDGRSEIYDLYVGGRPDIEGRDFYGSEDAAITVIAYIKPGSDVVEDFQFFFSYLNKTYISKGKARFYYKPLIDLETYRGRGEPYAAAKTISCMQDPPIRILFSALASDFSKSLKGEYLIDEGCMQDNASRDLLQDISEVRAFGIASNPTLYVGLMGNDNNVFSGIPTEDWIDDAVRNHEIQLGD